MFMRSSIDSRLLLRGVLIATTCIVTAPSLALAARAPAAIGRRSVLLTKDLPRGYTLKIDRSYTPKQIAAAGTYSMEQLTSWGYQAGYERQWDRESVRRPAQISSDAGVYRTARGARASLDASGQFCNSNRWHIVTRNVGVGSRGLLCSTPLTYRGSTGKVLFVVWLQGRIKKSVTYTTPTNQSSTRFVLHLAQRQARRH